MNLKPLVNNKDLYEDLLLHFDQMISQQHKLLEQASDTISIYQAQGAIKTLKKLKTLKEQVNG